MLSCPTGAFAGKSKSLRFTGDHGRHDTESRMLHTSMLSTLPADGFVRAATCSPCSSFSCSLLSTVRGYDYGSLGASYFEYHG